MSTELQPFDPVNAITLRDAIASGKLTFRGKVPTLLLVQRWANPNKGRRPLGPHGPQVVLPSVLAGRERLLMSQWLDWFNAEVRRVMVAVAPTGGVR